MYRISAKQLILLTFLTAILGGAVVVLTQRALLKSGAGLPPLEPTAIADPSVASEEQNNIDVYRMVSPGVVNITSSGYSRNFWGYYPSQGTGSGSIIDAEGHIVTNYHVIQNASQLEVQIENEKFQARVVGIDRDNDLAVIKVDNVPRGKLTIVKFGTSSGLQVGQKVLAIGNPFGLQRTMTTGIISGLERPLRDPVARRTIEGAIQTDASINPGNSGGPLLNSHGEMIGINTAIYSPNGEAGGSIGIGFAVPADLVKKTIPDLISKGYVARPWLGFSTQPLSSNIVRAFNLPFQNGLMVGDVYRGTGAAAAGIHGWAVEESIWGGVSLSQLGDIILSIDGKPVASLDDQNRILDTKAPGQTVQLVIYRNDRKFTVPLRLSERPRDQQ